MFLHGEQLSTKIRKIMAEPGARCAVAFWGAKSADEVKADAKIICNLEMGGTNPKALRHLRGVEIRQVNNLHAKVYIGKSTAIVASANASVNGLGLQGSEQAKWQEAGVELDEISTVSSWFDARWKESLEISETDWDRAQVIWDRRQKTKPTLPSILDYDFQTELSPIPTWAGRSTYEILVDSIKGQHDLSDEDIIRHRVDGGMEIEGPEDETILPNRWVLMWRFGDSGLPPKSSRAWWLRLSNHIARRAIRYSYKDADQDHVLGIEDDLPEPFNANDAVLTLALRETLKDKKYSSFREEGYEGSWFAPREDLFKPFWSDLKENYARLSDETKRSAALKIS